MRFRVLGAFQVADGAVSLGGKQRRLLAALLLHANHVVPLDTLIGALWGEDAPPSAHRTVQAHVSRLRAQLAHLGEGASIETRHPGYLLELDPGLFDAACFERHLDEARADLGANHPDDAIARLDEALDLWRGPAYAEFADEDFARPEAVRLEELHLRALETRADAYLAAGRHGEIGGELESLVAAHPMRERFRAQLMLARYRAGRHAEALEVYRDFRARLADDLGLDPSAALQQLERDILAQAPHLDAPGPAPAAGESLSIPARARAEPAEPAGPVAAEPAGPVAPGPGSAPTTTASTPAPSQPAAAPTPGEPAPAAPVPAEPAPAEVPADPARATAVTRPSNPAEAPATTPAQPQPALAPERKYVTVLLADLTGLDDAGADPEDVLEAAEPAIAAMTDAIHRYDGTVTRTSTSGLTALFGAPQALEDHAVRAAWAALALVAAAAEAGGGRLRARVGLHTGEVLVRAVSADVFTTYEAVGPVVDVARGLQNRADPGAVLASGATIRLAAGSVEASRAGSDGDVDRWRVHAVAARTPWEARTVRGLTAFAGRHAELSLMRRRVDLATDGEGQVIAIVGEAGVGKSRLAVEFRRHHLPDVWVAATAAASPYATRTPYQPLVDVVSRWLRADEGDGEGAAAGLATADAGPGEIATVPDAAAIAAALERAVTDIDPALLPSVVPPLRALLGLEVEDPDWARADAAQRRRRTHTAFTDLILGYAVHTPLLFVVEDLHWADGETAAVVDALVDALPGSRLALLVTYRPEVQPRWLTRSYVETIRLAPLRAGEAGDFLTSVLGDDPTLETFKRRILRWTGGSPLFIEEVVRDLADSGVLEGEPGAHRLGTPIDTVEVPTSLHGVLTARIDRLPASQKALLQTAAVVGTEGPIPLLLDSADGTTEEALSDLAALQAGEFIFERHGGGDVEFTFKHTITHDAVYASLPRDRRRSLHDRVARAIRERYGDRLSEQAARLGQHALRAEQWADAARLLHEAGEQALDRSAHREAADLFEQAIEALEHLPETDENLVAQIEARMAMRPSLVVLAELDRVLHHLRRAEDLARRIDDPARTVMLKIHEGFRHNLKGDMPAAITAGNEALEGATALNDPVLVAESRLVLAQTYSLAGDAPHTLEVLRPAMAVLTSRLRLERHGMAGLRSVWALGHLAIAHAIQGDFRMARHRADEATAIADEGRRTVDLQFSRYARSVVDLEQGNVEEAEEHVREGLEFVTEVDTEIVGLWLRVQLGRALLLAGRRDEAGAELAAVLAVGRARDLYTVQAWGYSGLAEVLLGGGDTDEAARQVQRAIELATRWQHPHVEAKAMRILGTAWTAASPRQAEVALADALTAATDLGARPEIAHVHAARARLYAATGRDTEASVARQHAVDLYAGLGMQRWLDAPIGTVEPDDLPAARTPS